MMNPSELQIIMITIVSALGGMVIAYVITSWENGGDYIEKSMLNFKAPPPPPTKLPKLDGVELPKPRSILMKKPPIGLLPEYLWDEQRMKDLEQAMERYHEAGKFIPRNWVLEYNTLKEKYR